MERKKPTSATVSPAAAMVAVALLDSLVVVGVGYVLYVLYYVQRFDDVGMGGQYLGVGVLGAMLLVQRLFTGRAYRLRHLLNMAEQLRRIAVGWTVAVLLVVAALFLVQKAGQISRGWIVAWYAVTLVTLTISRGILQQVLDRLARSGIVIARRMAVVGPSDLADEVVDRLGAQSGDFAIRRHALETSIGSGDPHHFAARIAEIKCALRAERTSFVLVLPIGDDQTRQRQLLESLREIPADVHYCPVSEQPFTHRGPVMIGDLLTLRIWQRPLNEWQQLIKRVEDIVIAGTVLLLIAPLLALVALAVRLDSKGPIVFRQPRFGFNNRRFEMLKFRTMYVDKGDRSGSRRTTRDDPRVTRLGRLLRRTSIDELPQLWNVLKGDMSIVGPRAHPVAMKVEEQYYHEAVEQYFARHRVRPGITGWAQINGLRGEVDTLDKARRRVAYDLFYVEHWSIMLDCKIIILTLFKGFVGKNAY